MAKKTEKETEKETENETKSTEDASPALVDNTGNADDAPVHDQPPVHNALVKIKVSTIKSVERRYRAGFKFTKDPIFIDVNADQHAALLADNNLIVENT